MITGTKSRTAGFIIFLLWYLFIPSTTFAQDFGLKVNALSYAATNLNIGAELKTGESQTVQLFGTLNPWTYNAQKRMRFFNVMPEYRWWSCRAFGGWFFGVHGLGGIYNVRNIDLPFKTLPDTKRGRHYEGWYIGGGVTAGYQWLLSKHWNLEAEVGVGYAYSPYKLYGRCQKILNRDHRNYVGPTKVGINFEYFF